LAVLAVLLYMPSDLDKTGSLEGIFVQFLDNTLLLIVEDEVVGNENFYNRFTKWISVMIDFILSSSEVRCCNREPQRQKGDH
jgi:hypothetical protein